MSPTITSGFIPSSSSASAPPSTAMSTGLKSLTYGRTIRRSRLWPGPRATTRAWRSRKRVRSCGKSIPSVSSFPSSRRYCIVFSANDSSAWVTRLCCSARLSASPSGVSAFPVARHVPLRKRLAPRTLSSSPSVTESKSGAPGASINRIPPRTRVSGPGLGNRPLCESATLTTTRTPDSSSSSAETRSRSVWSMIAMSSGESRLTRCFVRLSIRALPVNSTKLI